MAPGSVSITLRLVLKVKVVLFNVDVTRQVKELLTASMHIIRLMACFLHTPLAMDERMLSIGARAMVVIQAVALFRVFWVTEGLSMAMGLTRIVDFGRNNTAISLETIKVSVTAMQCLLRGGGEIIQAFFSGQPRLE